MEFFRGGDNLTIGTAWGEGGWGDGMGFGTI